MLSTTPVAYLRMISLINGEQKIGETIMRKATGIAKMLVEKFKKVVFLTKIFNLCMFYLSTW